MKKIFGINVLSSKNSAWNNGFDGMFRSNSLGQAYATDKAKKYTMRKQMELLGDSNNKVLITAKKDEDGKYFSLKNMLIKHNEKYEFKKEKHNENFEIMKNIYKDFIDVRLFGAIINPQHVNFSLTGPVQYMFAENQYRDENNVITNKDVNIQISSFKTSGENNEIQTTIGSFNGIEKSYFVYPIVVTPKVYEENSKLYQFDNYEEQYEKDIENFLEISKYDVTNMQSVTKAGTNNFFNLYIFMKDDKSNINLLSIQNNVAITEKINEDKTIVSINLEDIYTTIKNNQSKIDKIVIQSIMMKNLVIDIDNFEEKINDLNILVENDYIY